MKQKEILAMLERVGAVITGSHIVYASGKHGSEYVNKDGVYPHTANISQLCMEIAAVFSENNVEVVIGPATGGVILSQWTAYHLSQLCGHEVLSVYSEKDGEEFVIRRGYDKLVTGKRVLIVEDILTTGGSVAKVITAVRAIGGEVVGLGALCNRGGVTAEAVGDVPILHSLVNISLEMFNAAECPFCAQHVPINTEVGHGKKFLEAQATAQE